MKKYQHDLLKMKRMDDDSLARHEHERSKIEEEDMNKVDDILGHHVDLEEFIKMNLGDIEGLTPSQKDFLKKEKKKLKKLHDMDMEFWKEHPDEREVQEETVMDTVSEILGKPTTLEEFVRMNIPKMKEL